MTVEFHLYLQVSGDNESVWGVQAPSVGQPPSDAEETVGVDREEAKPVPRDRVLAAGTSVLAPGLSMPVGC